MYKKNISDQNDKLAKYKNAGDDFFDDLLSKKNKKTDLVGKQIVSDQEDKMSELVLEEKNPFILYQAGLENKDLGLLAAAKEGFIELLKLTGFKDIDLAFQLIDKIIICAEKSGDNKKAAAFYEIKKFRLGIENGEAAFRERRKNKLNKEQDIYELISQWTKLGQKEAQIIYAFHKKYARALDDAGLKEEAISQYKWLIEKFPDDLYNYIYFADFYTEQSKDQDNNYLLAKELLQRALDKSEKMPTPESQRILTEIKITYWRLCRQNDRFEKCKDIVSKQLEENDVDFIREHFRINLNFKENDIVKLNYNFKQRFERIIPEIRKLFLLNGLEFKEYVPESVHFYNIVKINFYNEVRKDSRFALGNIFVEDGDLENMDLERKINIFLKGLTEEEIYLVLLHEIGHNSYFSLTDQEKDEWQKFVKKYQLDQNYLHQPQPAMEAYADHYAIFILFNDLWEELARKEEPGSSAKNLVLFNFFKMIFRLDKEEQMDIIFKREKLKDDFDYFNKNMKEGLFYFLKNKAG